MTKGLIPLLLALGGCGVRGREAALRDHVAARRVSSWRLNNYWSTGLPHRASAAEERSDGVLFSSD